MSRKFVLPVVSIILAIEFAFRVTYIVSSLQFSSLLTTTKSDFLENCVELINCFVFHWRQSGQLWHTLITDTASMTQLQLQHVQYNRPTLSCNSHCPRQDITIDIERVSFLEFDCIVSYETLRIVNKAWNSNYTRWYHSGRATGKYRIVTSFGHFLHDYWNNEACSDQS